MAHGYASEIVTLSASHRAFVRRHAGAWYERAVYNWDEEDRDAFVDAVLEETVSDPSYDLNYPSFHRAWEAARTPKPACMCPDDCGCHYPWRTNVCGCKGHA